MMSRIESNWAAGVVFMLESPGKTAQTWFATRQARGLSTRPGRPGRPGRPVPDESGARRLEFGHGARSLYQRNGPSRTWRRQKSDGPGGIVALAVDEFFRFEAEFPAKSGLG